MVGKRGWHHQPKFIQPSTRGKCPYCRKMVAALEAHIHDKHIGKKKP